jgi:hypothetical protein
MVEDAEARLLVGNAIARLAKRCQRSIGAPNVDPIFSPSPHLNISIFLSLAGDYAA